MNNGPPPQHPVVAIERPLYSQVELDKECGLVQPEKVSVYRKVKDLAGRNCTPRKCGKVCTSLLPILEWLPAYKWKEDLTSDLIAGFTVAIMHIPQGMAYAMLANVPPVVGIYMAFFPILIYILTGTSRHNSMGTFAVVCLMTGQVVTQFATVSSTETTGNATTSASNETTYTPIEVASAVSLACGFWQIVMGLLRLGSLSVFLSDVLVSGFTTGAAIHVFTSQFKSLFGVQIPSFEGILKIVYTYIAFFQNLNTINYVAVIISAITIAVLIINNELLKPIVSKYSRVPIPIELIVVIIGTLLSQYCEFQTEYGITVIGDIPTGFPDPQVPASYLILNVAVYSLIIAIVAYAIAISMAKIFAERLNYEVDPNQELLAQGASNIFGSFFSCAPITASLSRSMVQVTVGGKTQLTSVFSCTILVFVLLWIGPFFETLPNSILASIIVVALKGMFLQFGDLCKAWQRSKLDGIIWAVTFLSVVLLDISYGLVIGVVLALLSIVVLNQYPYVCVLGRVPDTDIYLDVTRYNSVVELPYIKIIHYAGGLHFANSDSFKNKVLKIVGISPKMLAQATKEKKRGNRVVDESMCHIGPGIEDDVEDPANGSQQKSTEINGNLPSPSLKIKFVVFDFASLSFLDPSGVKALNALYSEFNKSGIQMFLTGCSNPVMSALERCGFLQTLPENSVFPMLHNTIIHCSSLPVESSKLFTKL